MAKEQVIAGIDIGSTKVAVCAGQLQEGMTQIIALARVPNSGMRKGIVIDIEDCVSAISTALEQAERMAGLPISSAFIGIAGSHISVSNSRGTIAVSRPNGEISQIDVERAVEASRTIALPPNKEIIHVIPKFYIIDGQEGVKDPIGMAGVRLEVESLIIAGSATAIRNLTKCFIQAGLNIEELLYSPIATSRALLNKKQKESGVVLVDIGGGTTSLTVFEEKDIIYSNVLPIGSVNITNDIAIGLKTSLENAEKIKIRYGMATPAKVRESEKIEMKKIDAAEDSRVERKLVAEIIEARLKEIFEKIQNELRSIGKDGMLPAGAIFTGGGSLVEGLSELAKSELSLPAQIGYPVLEVSGAVDKLDDPVYSTSVGLMLEGFEKYQSSGYQFRLPKENLGSIVETARGWLKKFLP